MQRDDEALFLALSDAPAERIRAARRLTRQASDPEAAAAVLSLLLDARDTLVARETVDLLLAQAEPDRLRLVLTALARADASQFDKLSDALWEFDWQRHATAVRSAAETDGEAQRGLARVQRQLGLE